MTTPADSQPVHPAAATPEPHTEADTGPEDASSGGQVSEVASFKEPGEEISPEDSVAGAPEGESGTADEGPTGPDAVTNDERQDHHPAQDDVETTG